MPPLPFQNDIVTEVAEDIFPEGLDKSLLPSSSNTSLNSTAEKCRELMHQIRGHTYIVDNEDALTNLEQNLREMLVYLDKFLHKENGLAKAVEQERPKQSEQKIYNRIFPKHQSVLKISIV